MDNKKNFRNKENKKDENKNNKNTYRTQNKRELIIQNNDDIQLRNNVLISSKRNNSNLTKEKSDENDMNKLNNNTAENSLKSIKLQEKLKKLFLEKEKAKYRYNKQIIPEQLKYNSEDEESIYSGIKQESINNEHIKRGETNKNLPNKTKTINVIKKSKKTENKNSTGKKNKKPEEQTKENDNNNSHSKLTDEEEILKKDDKTNIDPNKDNSSKTKNNLDGDNKEIEENRQKYYKLLSSKTIEEEKKEDNCKKINMEKEEEKDSNIEKTKENEMDLENKNNKKNNVPLLSRSLEDVEKNIKKESNNFGTITNENKKVKSNRERISINRNDNNKKNVLKILELIKSKKSEREIIIQKKEEIIKRSRSQAINRKKDEEENKQVTKEENIEAKVEKKHNKNTNEKINNNSKNTNEVKPSITIQKIYKKNPTIHKINSSYKSNNYFTETSNKANEQNDSKMSLSPLNISRIKNSNITNSTNKTNKFIFNNRLQNLNKSNKGENESSINRSESSFQNTFYQTTNQIKPKKKYEKPKISNYNINNLFNSTKYMNKSLSKNKILQDHDSNLNDRYNNESTIYSPKKNKIKKMRSENSFTHVQRRNKLIENNNNNFYIKKNTLMNENRDLSRSNYNIYGNYPNIHNYYNNSKIFLKNKFISIHPSFSINSNNPNNIDEIEINSNDRNRYNNKSSNSRDFIRNNKSNLRKLGSGYLNMQSQGRYVYQKNKINKNKLKEKCFKEKEFNDSDNTDTDKIDDINYEFLRLGTEDMTYNNNKTIKNSYLNAGDSCSNMYPENNTFYQSNENKDFGFEKYNHIYKNSDFKDNIFLSQSSPFYQRKLKKINVSNTLNNMNYKRNYRLNKNNSILINIENILIFEEKFSNIITYLKNNLSIIKPCLDFWNYYYNSWIYEKIEKIFSEDEDIEIIRICINYLLLSIMICYYFSLKSEIISNSNYLLLQILEINYNSLMMIFQQIKNNVFSENQDNIFLPILIKIYNKYMNESIYINNNNFITTKVIFENNEKIELKAQNILSIKNIDFFRLLYNFSINIKQKSYIEINEFFIKYILNEENIKGSLFSSYFFINNDTYFDSINPPFLKSPNKKKLTLILDLNETLINFKYEENGEGYVRIRPFLFGFLEEVGQLYELIVFTSSEKEYADSVIEAIEHERTYFDHVFYRQHTIIVGNDFVKDLTRIGRPLNSTIIIDNMPQNFKLQKENGILIKPFWGEDSSDRTLYDLMPILLDIAKEGGDVRYALNKYRNEIIGKISSNIAKKILYG